jgi:hypothetical protein
MFSFILKILFIHLLAYFFILFFFVVLLNIYFKLILPTFTHLILNLKLLNEKKNFFNQNLSFLTLNFSKKNLQNKFKSIKSYPNLKKNTFKTINYILLKLKKKNLIKKKFIAENNINYKKNKFSILPKIGTVLQSKIFGLNYIYSLIFKTKIFNIVKLFKINIIMNFLFFLVLFYLNLNLLYSLKFESTFLIFLFGFFVFLIYQFASNLIINYLDNESLVLYNFILDEISIQKKKITNLLNFQKLNLVELKNNLNKLTLKFLLILTNFLSLFFNNTDFNYFLFFYFFLINLNNNNNSK